VQTYLVLDRGLCTTCDEISLELEHWQRMNVLNTDCDANCDINSTITGQY